MRIGIVGTGFGGLGMAIQLLRHGFDDVTVFERSDRIGGTWRENRYPGAACDVPSHLYSFSFEVKHDWSRAFAEQPEILAYLEHCADKYDVRRRVRFQTEVASATFADGGWTVRLGDGREERFDVFIAACGQLLAGKSGELIAVSLGQRLRRHFLDGGNGIARAVARLRRPRDADGGKEVKS